MFWARCVTNVGKREKLVDLSGLQQRFFFFPQENGGSD